MKKCVKLTAALRAAFKNIQAAEKIGCADNADAVTARVAANAYYYRRKIRETQKDIYRLESLPGRDGVPYIFRAVWSYFKQNGFIFDKTAVQKALADYDCGTFELDMLKVVTDAAALIETGLVCAAAITNKNYGVNRLQNALTMMKKAEVTDFCLIFSELSSAERELVRSEEFYAEMTAATKAAYRKALRKYARKHGVSEKEAVIKARETAYKKNCCIGKVLSVESKPKAFSFTLFCVSVFALLCALAVYLCPLWALPLLFIPLVAAALGMGDFFFAIFTRTTPCPAVSPDKLPQKNLTLTVITTLLDDNPKSVTALERLYLTNSEAGLYFGLLADLPSAKAPNDKNDEKLLTNVIERIKALNARYGNRFCLFVRKRSKAEDGSWNGRERKRGAIEELVRYLNGGEDVFLLKEGPDVTGIPFLLTLDADTSLPPEGVATLTGMMLHPLNRPVIDNGTVVDGYGILQPGVQSSLECLGETRFAAMLAGVGGIDVYESAAFNRQQSIFGEGIFCGKGIIDVKAYSEVLDGVLPNGRVLSHDMPEGNILKTRYVSDLCFTDNVPSNVLSYYKRLHRWIRGDVQNLSLVFKYKQGIKGSLRIIQNVFRHLLPVISLITLGLAGVLNGAGRLWVCLLALINILSPIFFTIISRPAALRFRRRRFFSSVQSSVFQSLSISLYESFALCHKALISLDAVFKAVYRLISGKKLLMWVTAAQAEKGADKTFVAFIYKLFPSALLGSLFFFFTNIWPTRLLGFLWFLFPLYAFYLSHKPTKRMPVSTADKKLLREKAAPIWSFFQDNVGEHTAWLPPDNIQSSPVEAVAMRTSPTNIGLYLLSILAAEDFGFISAAETEKRLAKAFDSMDRMKKWNGHFYNWYELERLSVLGSGYISTVDSGNLCVCLVALSRSLYSSGRTSLAKRCEAFFLAADFTRLYNSERNLFSLGFDEGVDRLSDICYDLYMSEARSTSYFALSFGLAPVKHWRALGRPVVGNGGHIGMASWSGTAFEYFMPQLFLPLYKDSFIYESLCFALYEQKRFNKGKLWGCSESAYYCFDSEMNYQYKAHGVQTLALTRYTEKEMVLSPYSVYLALCISPSAALRTLTAYENEVGSGKYGLYEAVDCLGGGVIHSYMAHHMGMSLIACANACFDNIFVRRFMNHPRTAAFYELLQEKIPINAPIFNAEKQVQTRLANSLRGSFAERLTEHNPAEPVVHISGKGANTIVADSCGHIRFSHGDLSINEVHFDRFSASRSLSVLFCDGAGVYSAAPFTDNGKFSFESAAGYAAHICSSTEFSGRVKYYTDAAGCFITETKSDGGKSYSLVFSFDVQLASDKQFYSHPAFSRLFVSADYDKSTNTLIYTKNTQNGKDSIYMAVGLSNAALPLSFETNKDSYNAFSLYHPFDIIKEAYTNTTGVCVTPFCLIKTPPIAGGEARLIISVGHSKQEALDRLNASRHIRVTPVGRAVFGERENPLLAGLFYGQGRFAKTCLVTENALWSYGISGDYPIIAVLVREYYKQDIAFYIRVFKQLAALNIRMELVFLVREEEKYSAPNANGIRGLIRAEKCDSFVGKRGGIFFADGNNADTVAMFKDAAACFTESFDTPFSEKSDRRFAKPLPQIERRHGFASVTDGTKVGGGAYSANGFIVDKDSALKLPFSYVLAGRGFGSVVTHSTLGYSFYGNSALRRIAAFSGDIYGGTDKGEMLYFFCEGDVFDLTACASQVKYENGVAVYQGTVCKKSYTLKVFVCEKLPLKVLRLRFENDYEGDAAFFVAPLMGSGAFPADCVKSVKLEFKGGTAEGFCCTKSSFFGEHLGFAACLGSGKAYYSLGELLCGEPNGIEDTVAIRRASKETVFLLGAAPTATAAVKVLEQFFKNGADKEEEKAVSFASSFLPPIKLACQNKALEAMFGVFAPYQTAACRFFGRGAFYQSSGAYGFRDQLQDCLYLVCSMPDIVRTHLIRCAARQYTDGSVQHWWHPCRRQGHIHGVRTKCSDDFLWLPLCVADYIEKTGDYGILRLEIPYLVSEPLGEHSERYEAAGRTDYKESLYMHCVRAIEHGKNYGSHGLPLIGSCDWNDAFSALGEGAESVFCAFLYVITLKRFANVARLMNDNVYADSFLAEAKTLLKRAEGCYDKSRFVRAYTGYGAPLGTEGRAACEIDILVQSFAVFAEADKQKCKAALENAYNLLYDSDNKLIKLFAPPFGRDTEYAGYINAYAKGVRENGGQYTHAAVWFTAALAMMGMKEEAFTLLNGINPLKRAENKILFSRYKAEPYAIAADIYTARGQLGRGGWSFYTGAAGWFCKTVLEVFMGINYKNGYIDISPLFEYEATLLLNGEISITAKKGVLATVDGAPLALPLLLDGKKHVITVPIKE